MAKNAGALGINELPEVKYARRLREKYSLPVPFDIEELISKYAELYNMGYPIPKGFFTLRWYIAPLQGCDYQIYNDEKWNRITNPDTQNCQIANPAKQGNSIP